MVQTINNQTQLLIENHSLTQMGVDLNRLVQRATQTLQSQSTPQTLASSALTGLLAGVLTQPHLFDSHPQAADLMREVVQELARLVPLAFAQARQNPLLSFTQALTQNIQASPQKELLQTYLQTRPGKQLLALCDQALKQGWNNQQLANEFVQSQYRAFDFQTLAPQHLNVETIRNLFHRFMGDQNSEALRGANFARILLSASSPQSISPQLRNYLESQGVISGIAETASFCGIASNFSGHFLSIAWIGLIARSPASLVTKIGSAVLCGAASSLGQVIFQTYWATRNMSSNDRWTYLSSMNWNLKTALITGMACGVSELLGASLLDSVLGHGTGLARTALKSAINFSVFNVSAELASDAMMNWIGVQAAYVGEHDHDLLAPQTLCAQWLTGAGQEVLGSGISNVPGHAAQISLAGMSLALGALCLSAESHTHTTLEPPLSKIIPNSLERQNLDRKSDTHFSQNAVLPFLQKLLSPFHFSLPTIPAPALALAGIALTCSSFLNSETAQAMTENTSSVSSFPFASILTMMLSFSFYLTRKKADESIEPPKGKPWNDHGQQTRIEEALEMINKEGLEAAREHLKKKEVHLIAVLGSGRHGVSSDKMSVQGTQHNQKLFGKNVLHVLLTHDDAYNREQADRMNYTGSNTFVGGAPINTENRSAMWYSDPKYNDDLLKLADSVLVTLPTSSLEAALTQNETRIKNLKPDAQLSVGMKAILSDGGGLPASIYLSLAKAGRFDLMYSMIFQTGLGFPTEMVGHESPAAPIKFSFDGISEEALLKGMKTFAGDLANVSEDRHTVTAANKVFQKGHQVFLANFLAYMKNAFAADDGYRFCNWVIEKRKQLIADDLEEELCKYRKINEEEAVDIFSRHEAPKVNAEKQQILEAINNAQSQLADSCLGLEHVSQLKEFFKRPEPTNPKEIRAAFLKNETGLEDLKGCTQLRHADSFLKILNELFDSEGLDFEEAFTTFWEEMKKEVSSTNFLAGIGRRVNEELITQGKVSPEEVAAQEKKKKDKTIEGLVTIDSIDLRWNLDENSQPDFVTRVKAWKDAPYQTGESRKHSSGLPWQTMRVIRDYVTRLDEARSAMHKDLKDNSIQHKAITDMRDTLVLLIHYLKVQKENLQLNPEIDEAEKTRKTQEIQKQFNLVLSDLEQTQFHLSTLLTEWNQKPSSLSSVFGSAFSYLSSLRLSDRRRNEPLYKIRESLSHRLEALYKQLREQFKLEENNLSHWETQASSISWLNREIAMLGYADRVMRFQSRRAQ